MSHPREKLQNGASLKVERALTDAAARKPAIDIEEWGPKIEAFAADRAKRAAAREKAASVAYLAKAAAEPGVVFRELHLKMPSAGPEGYG